jgi:hypothetical protein
MEKEMADHTTRTHYQFTVEGVECLGVVIRMSRNSERFLVLIKETKLVLVSFDANDLMGWKMMCSGINFFPPYFPLFAYIPTMSLVIEPVDLPLLKSFDLNYFISHQILIFTIFNRYTVRKSFILTLGFIPNNLQKFYRIEKRINP